MEDGQKVTPTLTDVNGKSVTFIATVTGGKFSTTVDLGASAWRMASSPSRRT
ncbi:hypothetical protein [Aeromonas veronii]|uniref:hypothetical protein n=1 Tax=Aeromonas veronii TaxID=654 RepID=UPI0024865EC9|nr:hypothetical protein [Aeromonas veronii]